MSLQDVVFKAICCLILIVALLKYCLKLLNRPCTSKVCLVGKTVLITGGNRGIGYETTLGLAARGCKVIIACRSNADQVKENIIKKTHNPNIITRHLDLASLESIRKFCQEIHETEEKIDILINNAGTSIEVNEFTKDGLHPTMQANLFGPFLLTHLLIDLLKKSGHARIIFVSSHFSFVNNLTVENLNVGEGKPNSLLNVLKIYSNSKLGQIIVSHEFSERLKPYGITSNALHPGIVRTEIFDKIDDLINYFSIGSYILWLIKIIFFKTPEEGSRRVLRLAVSNCFENVTGKFIWALNLAPSKTKNREFRRKIWRRIEEYVKLSEEEKIHIS